VAAQTAIESRRAQSPSWLARARAFRPAPAQVAGALVLGFIALTAWWLSQDARVPDFDSGDHLQHTSYYYELMRSGHFSDVLRADNPYPPVVEVLPALVALVTGISISGVVLTTNIIFVPLLALGCYGTARIVAGPWAGLLAVVFAFGTPIIGSEFHEFLIDPPLAALVALTVWFLLASDRFRDIRWVLLAGGAAGVGMLTKQTFPFYIAGLIVVMLARGGWRNWRHVLAFGGVVFAIAWGYYLYHFNYLQQLSKGVIAGDANSIAQTGLYHAPSGPDNRVPAQLSLDNTLWYFWSVLNHVLLLPYALLFGGGTIAALVAYVRRPRKDNLVPELIGGAVIGWVLITYYMSLHDNRYVMPLLVYAAVLGTAWVVRLPRRWALAAGGGVAALAALQLAAVTFGLGSRVAITLPGAPKSDLGVGRLTLYSPEGWLVAGPDKAGDIPAILRKAKRDGVQNVGFETGGSVFFNHMGLWAIMVIQEWPHPPVFDKPQQLDSRGLYIFTRPATGRYAHPCLRAADGAPVFFAYGGQKKPFSQWTLSCPRP
jgi:4-amino-4-deoxy-L-arabinose transferase-like glycosyltransferase